MWKVRDKSKSLNTFSRKLKTYLLSHDQWRILSCTDLAFLSDLGAVYINVRTHIRISLSHETKTNTVNKVTKTENWRAWKWKISENKHFHSISVAVYAERIFVEPWSWRWSERAREWWMGYLKRDKCEGDWWRWLSDVPRTNQFVVSQVTDWTICRQTKSDTAVCHDIQSAPVKVRH